MAKNKVKVGDHVKVIGNCNSNDYTVGQIYRVTAVNSGSIRAESLDGRFTGNNLADKDFIYAGMDKSFWESELAELTKKADDIRSIIEWMDATGSTEYDENEHRVWKVLNAVENQSLSRMEKVKIIASLVK